MNRFGQFRILYRVFLFRLMDVELLSASAHGDSSEVLGQFGALLVFGSFVLTIGAATVGRSIARNGSVGLYWTVERFLISITMLTVGVFALLSWESAFPDRRDVLVLSPLPVRARTLVAAKIAASASALGSTVAALNSLAGFAWPLVLAPPGAGLTGTIRIVAAFWVAIPAAGMFLYCAILTVQGLAAQLPRRLYLRASPLLQIGAFVLFVGVMCFQPTFLTQEALVAPDTQRALASLPTYWFLGLFNELSGGDAAKGQAAMFALARRAVTGLAVSLVTAGGAFLLSYFRTLGEIVEEPDGAGRSRGWTQLLPFGHQPTTAVAQFAIRTLIRSRQHRAVLAFYAGSGLAVATVYLEGAREAARLTGADMVHSANVPVMAAGFLMLCAAWLGTRTAFSLPADLRANWVFQITPAPQGADRLSGVRGALLTVAIFPVWAGCAMALFWYWPWKTAAEHLGILGLLAFIVLDLSLTGLRKIPFTCSWLPGKSKVHMVFWFGIIPLVIAIHQGAALELRSMQNVRSYCVMFTILAAIALAARCVANASARGREREVQFEESASDELTSLGLTGIR